MTWQNGKGVDIPRLHCKYHPQAELIDDYSSGDMVCSECGLVVGDRIICEGAEWRNFDDDDVDRCRVGYAADPIFGEDLTTQIQAQTSGEPVVVRQFKKSATQMALIASNRYLKDLCAKMHISEQAKMAALQKFKRVKDKNALKCKNKETVMACILYMECRRLKMSRTIAEFYSATGICKRDFCKVFKSMCRMFEEEETVDTEEKDCSAPAKECMDRFCTTLGLSLKVSQKAKDVVEKIMRMDLLGGCSSITLTSAAIYLVARSAGCTKTIKEISNVTSMGEPTIKKALMNLTPHIKELLA